MKILLRVSVHIRIHDDHVLRDDDVHDDDHSNIRDYDHDDVRGRIHSVLHGVHDDARDGARGSILLHDDAHSNVLHDGVHGRDDAHGEHAFS